mmetsp:Transcript_21097/g.52323  ORF Transcript_21097/g.52323 Transcript_21097/m.52323 type:complete len:351 (+) Transcript_21097:210-1262(+)|eukprot:CAMPEP_0116087962 /NCGR_PEP_ID=MMETSP0327-20121206/5628_1 /TAXON_ID=44447 /ORGANISM="Pseudo-nitzschia delicatissima, Strain B596" /LENGTH=350 /DNA_ID=CAMNT_0003579035 /DNA_START=151 /DNA_END=1203 /DNA_ORIENTATION=-
MPPAPNGAVRRRGAANNNFATLQQQQSNFQSKPYFMGAPITKILCILWAAGSLWVIRSDNTDSEVFENHRNYDYNRNLWGAALWSGPSSWVFESTTELVVGLSFLAHFLRRLEQELSSRRLVAWFIMLEAVYLFVRLLAVATLDEESVGAFVGGSVKGPYLFVGGVLYWYKAFVPRLYPRFLSNATLGISCSEKTLPYAWALYVLCMGGTASILVGVIGVLASAIYFFLLFTTNGNSNIPLVDIPDALVNLLPWESLGGLFLVDASPKVYAPFITRAAMNPRGQRRQRGAGRRAPAPVVEQPPIAVAVAVPSPEAVAQLTSMGFEEDRVKEALRASDNNVERAANLLLAG